ncbi:MAG: asparagine synthase (glutamine-hydrolyzing) [Zoogloea sp.]|uniref:asparagine synthase (glutamine-hydrolyzing) n=1 Tax=Zoogloea sp. TaxID=49181 RepID=UPI002626F472|nr:asparagine synthase (glutamine-hydrolyzing) [Zoogloea sp.]MDD2989156.1 asparagine synthase (glutamine-hydrolyzing) [Zoogloea sp.]
MCGITGALSLDGLVEQSIRRMTDTLFLRGPDDGGVWLNAAGEIGLGHRRLSILDLSPAGHQPMHSACGRFVIAFNGEVYNHLDLRTELESAGDAPSWRGHSDTETLLAGIAAWGLAATLKRAVGMFAMAVWDHQTRTLQLARDRIGEKPLYYGWVQGAFVFGSELKALRAYPGFDNPIDRDVLALYFQFCAVPAPYSIYKDVFKLEPGCILSLQAECMVARNPAIEPYWSFVDVVRKGMAAPIDDEHTALEALESVLKQAIAAQSVADVPLGAFLSGGVDSSAIVALMQSQSSRPVQTFTIGFDEAGFDESPYAMAVAGHLGTEHNELRVRASDALAVIPTLSSLYDEPFADSSQIPTHIVCRAARTKLTVALSGDAGDELFGGYNRYFWGRRIWSRMGWIPLPLRQKLGSAMAGFSPDSWDRIGGLLSGARGVVRMGDKVHKLAHGLKTVRGLDDLYRSLVTEWPSTSKLVIGAGPLPTRLDDATLVAGINDSEHRMMLWDTLTYLPDDILTKVDRAAMGISLETRVPFLDHRVVEFAWRLPLNLKIRNGQGKWALRQVLYKYVPQELIERPKAGFGIPVGEWLRGPLREWAEALLDEERLSREGYLNPAPIRLAWSQHLSGRHDWTPRLWCVLMFQAWLESSS